MAYFYAKIRLGHPGFRLNGYEYDAAYRAVRHCLQIVTGVVGNEGYIVAPLLGMYLLQGHFKQNKYCPIYIASTETNATELTKHNHEHNKVAKFKCKTANKPVYYYRIEKDPKVVTELEKIVENFEKDEETLFGTDGVWEKETPPPPGPPLELLQDDDNFTTPVQKKRKKNKSKTSSAVKEKTFSKSKLKLIEDIKKQEPRTVDSASWVPLW